MAKKNATTKTATAEKALPFAGQEEVTVKDLVAHFNLDGKKVRAIIRSQGYRAPATGLTGMAPQAKYAWTPDSPKLAKIMAAITEFLNAEAEDQAEG